MSNRDVVVPLVVTSTTGGPFDERAYRAGWEAGQLDATLEAGKPESARFVVRRGNQPQVDLICMKHGYTIVESKQIPNNETEILIKANTPPAVHWAPKP